MINEATLAESIRPLYVMVSVPRLPSMTLVESRHLRHQALYSAA